MENFTRMIFTKNNGGSMSGSKGGSIKDPRGGQIGGQIPLTDRQRDILDLIKMDNKISRKRISELLDINQSAIIKHIDTLKQKGLLRRVGGTRGYWEVLGYG